MKWMVLVYLGINAWTDWKRREIDVRYTIFFVSILFVFQLFLKRIIFFQGIFPGVILWLMAKIIKGQIGEGDGIVCMAVGLAVGLERILHSIGIGFMLSFIAGCIACFINEKKKYHIFHFYL